MPNCIRFYPKSAPTEAITLIQLDENICVHLGVEVHPVRYVEGWFDDIAFYGALGKSYEEIRKILIEDYCGHENCATLLKILDYLEANYTMDSYYER